MPGLNRRIPSLPVKSTMVDSMPNSQSPPSRIKISLSLPNSAYTSAARVGETLPKRLAEGATNASPKAVNNSCANGWLGERRATVDCPPVIVSKTCLSFFKTKVNGPGQKARISCIAAGGRSRTQGLIICSHASVSTSVVVFVLASNVIGAARCTIKG